MTDITVRRLENKDDVYQVFKDKAVFKHICDDYTKNPDDFCIDSMIESEYMHFIGAYIDNQLAGVFYYHPHNHILYEVHSGVLPQYRGKNTILMAIKSLEWIFENTDCLKVITHVPENNAPALALSKRVGMQIEGINRASIMKNNQLLDQTVLGITAEELSCQQQQ